MEKFREIYLNINIHQRKVIEDTVSLVNLDYFTKNHLFLSDYERWIKHLSKEKEVIMYKTAMCEYANALFLLVSGFYRQAYITLRFSLEHTMFGLLLSVNELNFRRWSMNHYDMHWSEIIDTNNGVFCNDFFELFAPECAEYATELLGICKQLYREFSEFTHGNYRATQFLSINSQYDFNAFHDICTKIETMKYLITFMFFVRYQSNLSKYACNDLEQSIMDTIGKKPGVQVFYMKKREE